MALTLAIPSEGALHEPALEFLHSCGFGISRTNARRYTAEIRSIPQASALFQRAADITTAVDEGVADAGVVGLDRFCESARDGGSAELVVEDLGFGRCDLVLGVPDSWIDVTSLADLSDLSIEFRETVGDLRVGTKYPRLVSSFLHRNGVTHFSLVQPSGALEAMPGAGAVDVIADISETGTTMRENRLKTVRGGVIFASQACLIMNVEALTSDKQKMESAAALVERIEGRLNSEGFYSLTANLIGETAEEVAETVLRHSDISGISGPTISRVFSPGQERRYAVTVVVEKDRLLPAVELLREAGGTGITVLQPDYVFQEESRARRPMPNPMVHVDFACQAARALDHPVLNGNVGYVALGATSPDIRVITKQPREAYHFAGLDFESVGAGVEGMARAHPELFDRARHDEATQAFLAGYVSHLAMDETWITEMYRPYFGNRQVFEDEVEGQVMDRALQLDLDRESRPAAAEKAPMIDAARTGASVSFIPGETLDEWCDWVIGLIGRPFTMDRLRFMASRIARWDDTHRANHIAEEFLSAFPGSMDRLHERVPRERVARFKALAVERLSETMAEFLS